MGDFKLVAPGLSVLANLILMNDTETLTDACWALSYLSDDSGPDNKKIQAVVSTGVAQRLIQCLQHSSSAVQVPALRTVGNIVTGNDTQTQLIMNCNPLPALLGMMSARKKSIRKEACWTLSNMTAGNAEQIQMVIDANVFQPLIELVRSAEFDIQKEAAWALSNATSGGSPQQIRFLAKCNAISALCSLLICQDTKITMVAMEGIENMIRVGQKGADNTGTNDLADLVEECGGLDHLETLQRHDNDEVYQRAVKILTEYFDSESDDEGAGMAPQVEGNQFTFGGAASQNAMVPVNGFQF